jgi:hypothetical protein
MSDSQRAEMCQQALAAARRPEERKLVLEILERYPNVETLRVAVNASQVPELKSDADRVALAMATKLAGKAADPRELLGHIGGKPVQVEILKAEYGAGDRQKDVTEIVQKHARNAPLILLPSSTYNESFGGDPAPGTAKQLKVQFKIEGAVGEVSLPENALILLPQPTRQ